MHQFCFSSFIVFIVLLKECCAFALYPTNRIDLLYRSRTGHDLSPFDRSRVTDNGQNILRESVLWLNGKEYDINAAENSPVDDVQRTLQWVAAAGVFGGIVTAYKGVPAGVEYASGYVLEQMLIRRQPLCIFSIVRLFRSPR